MGLDVYFRRDIANVLRATACANEGAAELALELLGDADLCRRLDAAGVPPEKLLAVYRQGVRTTLVAVGLAFGLEPVQANIQRRTDAPGIAGLLWAECPHDRGNL